MKPLRNVLYNIRNYLATLSVTKPYNFDKYYLITICNQLLMPHKQIFTVLKINKTIDKKSTYAPQFKITKIVLTIYIKHM